MKSSTKRFQCKTSCTCVERRVKVGRWVANGHEGQLVDAFILSWDPDLVGRDLEGKFTDPEVDIPLGPVPTLKQSVPTQKQIFPLDQYRPGSKLFRPYTRLHRPGSKQWINIHLACLIAGDWLGLPKYLA